jgi:hypothetical protein
VLGMTQSSFDEIQLKTLTARCMPENNAYVQIQSVGDGGHLKASPAPAIFTKNIDIAEYVCAWRTRHADTHVSAF